MKLGKLIVAALLLVSANTFAQDDETKRECDRMLFLAQQARIEKKDYKESSIYMIKAENICGGLDAKNTKILIASLRNTINDMGEGDARKLYCDTLEGAWVRAEEKGLYLESDDLVRATNILGTSAPNREKADELYKRGIAAKGDKVNEGYLSYYYYNVYAMYSVAPAEKKPELKKEMITVYFELSALASRANMSAQTVQTLGSYFEAVVKTCDDILPDLKGFMAELPQDPEVKKLTVTNFISLLEKKECTESAEYIQLIDTLVAIDPNSFDAQLMKAKALIAQKKYGAAISSLKTAKGLTDDEAKKQEINYMIANAQYRSGSYTAAYNTAMSVQGEFRGKALVIAGNSVGKNANSCGNSTFERKCNYVYAVQLLQQASAKGENTGGAIGAYKAKYPTDEEIFDNSSPASVTLTCYGVSVNPRG